MKGEKMKQTTLDLIKNINENTFIPATTQNELFERINSSKVYCKFRYGGNTQVLYGCINSSKVYCKYEIGKKLNIKTIGINSSKVYCKYTTSK